MYQLAKENKINFVAGINYPFEEPENSHVVLNDYVNIQKCVEIVINKLIEIEYVKN